MENNHTLPNKWKVQITESNREVLEQWRVKQPGINLEPQCTCFNPLALNKWLTSDQHYDGTYMNWSIAPDYTEITFEQFKQFVLMENKPQFRPITMDCNKQQFDAIKPILEKHGFEFDNSTWDFTRFPYLTNNYLACGKFIGNAPDSSGRHRPYGGEWNQELFLQCCGIESNHTEMKTYKVTIDQLKQIHDIACIAWQSKIKSLITDPFADHVELSQQQVDEMFKAANVSYQLPVLVSVFGEPKKHCPYKKGQPLWVWDDHNKYPNIGPFVEMGNDGRYGVFDRYGDIVVYWDNATPFNNGQLPDQFKHLFDNQ